MNTAIILQASVAALLFGASGALAASPTETPARAKASAQAQPAEFILVEEDYYVIQDEPHIHLTAATKAAAGKDWKTAGTELRKAGFFLKAEASAAAGDTKAALHQSAQELGTVGKDLENGVAHTDAEVKHAITGAYASLAHHHYRRAAERRTASDWDGAKRELAAAANAVERKLESGGEAIDEGTQALLKDCREAASATEAKADQAEAAIGSAIDSLGKKMEHLGMAAKKHD